MTYTVEERILVALHGQYRFPLLDLTAEVRTSYEMVRLEATRMERAGLLVKAAVRGGPVDYTLTELGEQRAATQLWRMKLGGVEDVRKLVKHNPREVRA